MTGSGLGKVSTSVEMVPVAALAPYAGNARTHSAEQVRQICASIREFGFTSPVLIDAENGIVAGHGRVLAAQRLGMAQVPTVRLGWLTEAQKRAYVLADNQIAMNAGWDPDLLKLEVGSLRLEGFDLDVLGFSDEELAGLLSVDGGRGGRDVERAPEVEPVAVSKPGDVWICGAHRVVCGDCTDHDVISRLMAGVKAHACWTDPPYNVAYGEKAEFLNDGKGHRNTSRILNDDMDDSSFRAFLAAFFRSAYASLREGGAIYVAHSETERHNFTSQFLIAGFKLSGVVVWKKNALVLGRSDYQWIHEPVIYGWKPGAKHRWYGGRKKTTVQELEASPFVKRHDGKWEINIGDSVFVVSGDAEVHELVGSVASVDKPVRNDVHPTMKPVALIERMLKNSAKTGDVVLDPFGGSGSTMMAAERLGMAGRICELDPGYVDVIVRRWTEFTGNDATLEGTSKTFSSQATR